MVELRGFHLRWDGAALAVVSELYYHRMPPPQTCTSSLCSAEPCKLFHAKSSKSRRSSCAASTKSRRAPRKHAVANHAQRADSGALQVLSLGLNQARRCFCTAASKYNLAAHCEERLPSPRIQCWISHRVMQEFCYSVCGLNIKIRDCGGGEEARNRCRIFRSKNWTWEKLSGLDCRNDEVPLLSVLLILLLFLLSFLFVFSILLLSVLLFLIRFSAIAIVTVIVTAIIIVIVVIIAYYYEDELQPSLPNDITRVHVDRNRAISVLIDMVHLQVT